MPDQVVVHDRVRVVVVHDQHRETVDPGDLQRRHILLGRPVIHQEDHRHLLPVADVILEGEVDIPRDILNLIERRFGWRPLEEEVLRIEVSARLPDQRGHRLLDRDGSAYPIRIRVMPENDRPRGQDRLPDLLCHKTHLRPERRKDIALHEEREIGRFRTEIKRRIYPLPDPRRILRLQDCHGSDLDLELVVALHHLAHDADDIAEFDLRVGTDTRLDERGRVRGAGLIHDREDRRPRRLLDLGDLALNQDRPADLFADIGKEHARRLLGHVLGLVDRRRDLLKVDVAVAPDLEDVNDDRVTLAVLHLHVALMDESFDPVV